MFSSLAEESAVQVRAQTTLGRERHLRCGELQPISFLGFKESIIPYVRSDMALVCMLNVFLPNTGADVV